MVASNEVVAALLLAAPLSITGRYALLGRLAAAGVRALVADVHGSGGVSLGGARSGLDLSIVDDGGTREGVRRALDELADADLLLGPYGSDLALEAGRWAGERGRTLWNHGGSADEVQRLPRVVSVPSPAGRYFGAVLEALADALPGARVLPAVGRGRFGEALVRGAREATERLGMTVEAPVPPADLAEAPDADILLVGGAFEEDVEALRRLRERPPAVAAVGAGMGIVRAALGDAAEGILAPSQWEEGMRRRVDLGPRRADVLRTLRAEVEPALRLGTAAVDYPAAQAYAAGLLAVACAERAGSVGDAALLRAARGLRCTTFFGRFALSDDGLQIAHEMLVVQWQEGFKRVVWPPDLAEAPVRL